MLRQNRRAPSRDAAVSHEVTSGVPSPRPWPALGRRPRTRQALERAVARVADRRDAVHLRDVALARVLPDVIRERHEDRPDRRRLVPHALLEIRIGLLLAHRAVMLDHADVERRRAHRIRTLRRAEPNLRHFWLLSLTFAPPWDKTSLTRQARKPPRRLFKSPRRLFLKCPKAFSKPPQACLDKPTGYGVS